MGGPATQDSTVDVRVDRRTSSALDGFPTLKSPTRPQARDPPVELSLHSWQRHGSGEHSGDQLEITDTVHHLEAVPVSHVEAVGLDEVTLVGSGPAEPHAAHRYRRQVPFRRTDGAGVEIAQHWLVRPGYDVAKMRVTMEHGGRECECQLSNGSGQLGTAIQQEITISSGHRG